MVTSLIRELLTPISLEQNTNINKIMKEISKQQALLEDHTNFMLKIREQFEDIKVETKFTIANKDRETESY